MSGLVLLLAGCPGNGPGEAPRRVEGTFHGEVPRRALLIAPDLAEPLAGTITSGAYSIAVNRPLAEARVVLEGERGNATTSAKLSIAAVTTAVQVAPLHLWPARVEVQREGDRVRFSWLPFASEGARYSLLVAYRGTRDGVPARLEGSLVTKEPQAIQTLEQLAQILPDRDPAERELELQVRAYLARPDSPTWASETTRWTLPDR